MYGKSFINRQHLNQKQGERVECRTRYTRSRFHPVVSRTIHLSRVGKQQLRRRFSSQNSGLSLELGNNSLSIILKLQEA
jgi:hypothetical protein